MIDAMPAAQAGDMRSVHQARVASRRLREALPALGASVDGRALGRVRRQVRRMTRALGPVRELDVALAHLDELAARNVVSTHAIGRVRQALAQQRLKRRREMLAAITPGKVEKLRQGLRNVSSGEARPQSPEAASEIGEQIARRAERLVSAMERAGGLYLPDRLHAVRIAAKKLRYAMEIQRELSRSRATARITQLKRMQDLLGRMHDFEILIDRTRHVQADLAASNRKVTLELDALIRMLEAECRADHATYMRRRPSILKLCETLTTQAAPARAAVA
jgi:CHAD domain-containing protein